MRKCDFFARSAVIVYFSLQQHIGEIYNLSLFFQPRANEAGGLYGKGIIARKYQLDQVVKVRVELTANHMGFFEFRLCPNNNPRKPATQKCLDQNVLVNAKSGGHRFYPGPGSKVFEMHYQLPKGLTCRQCVFQWRYVAGNNWGKCGTRPTVN